MKCLHHSSSTFEFQLCQKRCNLLLTTRNSKTHCRNFKCFYMCVYTYVYLCVRVIHYRRSLGDQHVRWLAWLRFAVLNNQVTLVRVRIPFFKTELGKQLPRVRPDGCSHNSLYFRCFSLSTHNW